MSYLTKKVLLDADGNIIPQWFDVAGDVFRPLSDSYPMPTGTSISVGAMTIADGADAAVGATTDAAVVTDANGTLSGKLRGLVKILASVWNSVSNALRVEFNAPTAYASAAYEASVVVKATPGTLYKVMGYNSNALAQFIQVHDATTLPIDTSVPIVTFSAPGLSLFEWDAGQLGYPFAAGIVACNSATGPTKTIGTTDCWFNVLFK